LLNKEKEHGTVELKRAQIEQQPPMEELLFSFKMKTTQRFLTSARLS
jgi:hypothetical protein